MHSNGQLTHALEQAVETLFRQDPENVRPKAVRSLAEETLDLEAGYFATTGDLKARSKKVLQNKFESLVEEAQSGRRQNSKKRKSSDSETVTDGRVDSPAKRKTTKSSTSTANSQREAKSSSKRRPKSHHDGSDHDQAHQVDDVGSAFHSPHNGDEPTDSGYNRQRGSPPVTPATEGLDDSDLSSLVDEPPAKKSRKKKHSSTGPVAAKPKEKSKRPTDSGRMSSEEAEIRELQSQLLQCGIRKIWAMHLKAFSSHKDKVAELKRMLREAGMEGRFSKDRARQIKEARELKADIEAIQEGDEKWGKREDEKRRSTGRAQSRIVDFEDEESD